MALQDGMTNRKHRYKDNVKTEGGEQERQRLLVQRGNAALINPDVPSKAAWTDLFRPWPRREPEPEAPEGGLVWLMTTATGGSVPVPRMTAWVTGPEVNERFRLKKEEEDGTWCQDAFAGQAGSREGGKRRTRAWGLRVLLSGLGTRRCLCP